MAVRRYERPDGDPCEHRDHPTRAGAWPGWAEHLYGGYAWWFRLAGLAVTAGLAVVALRRRRSCSLAGVKAARWRLLLVLAAAVATYGVSYGLTTWAGTVAT